MKESALPQSPPLCRWLANGGRDISSHSRSEKRRAIPAPRTGAAEPSVQSKIGPATPSGPRAMKVRNGASWTHTIPSATTRNYPRIRVNGIYSYASEEGGRYGIHRHHYSDAHGQRQQPLLA